MDTLKGCLCMSSTEEHTYEDIDLQPMYRTYSREPSRFPSEVNHDLEASNSEPPMEVGLYCRLLTAEAYAEMSNDPFRELNNIWIVHLGNLRDPLHQRAVAAVDFHDIFGLIKAYLETWYLPCIVICRADPEEMTGLKFMAIGSTAAINWLSTMLSNPEIMMEYFCFAGIHFTNDSRSAVATPKELRALPPPPPNTPDRRVPRTQLRVPPPAAAQRASLVPDFNQESYLADASNESTADSESDSYLTPSRTYAMVH